MSGQRGRPSGQTPEQATAAKAAREVAKAEAFVKLAQSRMTKALQAIEPLGNLANKGSYSYTDVQVKAMGTALVNKVNEVFAKFTKTEEKAAVAGFDLGAAVAKIAPPAETPPPAE
jgi:hypothetical protein